MRRLIEVTTGSNPDIFCVFCGSDGGVIMCVWEDNWFFICVFEIFPLVRVQLQ